MGFNTLDSAAHLAATHDALAVVVESAGSSSLALSSPRFRFRFPGSDPELLSSIITKAL